MGLLFVKHCEQADHHPTMQQHLEKVEAIEVLHCTFSGPRLNRRGLVWYLLNLSKAHAPRGLDKVRKSKTERQKPLTRSR